MSILFVVHPGSACRSANDALGEDAAEEARSKLLAEMENWDGGIVVIDGRLSRDLGTKRFYGLGIAISDAMRRARAAGLPCLQIMGCDSSVNKNQKWAARRAVQELQLTNDLPVTVTGAWYDESDLFGCVNDVVRALESCGIDVTVSKGAVRMLADPDIAIQRSLGL